jgi:restriction system protein
VASNNPINVLAAFEMLLEEVEAEIEQINVAGAQAFQRRDYAGAQEAVKRGETITDFRSRVVGLRQEWISLSHGVRHATPARPSRTPAKEEQRSGSNSRRNLGHLPRGLKTPEEEYRIPILQALVEMGGAGRIGDVLQRVHTRMKDVLNDHDHQPLRSNPNTPRWYNTAQWARNTMAREGLLKEDSPHGVWEISDKGRRALTEKSR